MRPRGRLAFFSAVVLAALAAVLAVVIPAGTAPAAGRPAAGNRVWAISLSAPVHVRADRGVPADQRLGEPASCPFCAAGACVAPEAVGSTVYRTARLGLGQTELRNGLDPANFATGDQSAYVGDEAAARTLANPNVGSYENFYTRFRMHPDFESEFAKYKFPYPEGGPGSFEYQIPQNLIPRFNELTIGRTPVPF